MKNNYDLILNFEKRDGVPLTKEETDALLNYAEAMVSDIESDGEIDIQIWKAIVAQGVQSRRMS